ncbi:hypothetical protein LJ707_04825 [Mucilaginibacter sp. UR6-1]|uniref:anti-sigma factor family protein n=1 Tax=Mucilaginibacter sp. UR6-1 TaxID=1435643 RepID=UPI001E3655C3|nr:hypothetical protein [Mucilaginibacter sp. UR6-1]MCC8408242.1 hypothetical protein [Mucilaginibacter sp. UR6-1]
MKKELKTELERIAYNCRKATLLIEKKQEVKLTMREKLELKLHLAGCSICRIYEKQSVLINLMMQKLFKEERKEIRLDSSYKLDLQKRINDQMIGNQ